MVHGGDLPSPAIGGAAAGIAAAWAYSYKKNSEHASTRNDMAIMPANEIRCNVRAHGVADARPMRKPFGRMPSMDAYKGMLPSGNMRYSSSAVQDTMDKTRAGHGRGRMPDIGLQAKAPAELERMPASRDRFFAWVPHRRRRVKAWRRRRGQGPQQPGSCCCGGPTPSPSIPPDGPGAAIIRGVAPWPQAKSAVHLQLGRAATEPFAAPPRIKVRGPQGSAGRRAGCNGSGSSAASPAAAALAPDAAASRTSSPP